MTILEKMKHLEPHMSLAFQTLAKLHFNDLREYYGINGGSKSFDRSMQSSAGFIDGFSNLKFSEELSIYESEKSFTHSALVGYGMNLETINEDPRPKIDIKNFN